MNRIITEHSTHIDQLHISRKVLTAPVSFLFYLVTSTLKTLLGPVGDAIDRMSSTELERRLTAVKSNFEDILDQRWSEANPFIKESRFPEAMELIKLQRVLAKKK